MRREHRRGGRVLEEERQGLALDSASGASAHVSATAAEALRLQRLAGNEAVTSVLVQRDRGTTAPGSSKQAAPPKHSAATYTMSVGDLGKVRLLSIDLSRVKMGEETKGKRSPSQSAYGDVAVTMPMGALTAELTRRAAKGEVIEEVTIAAVGSSGGVTFRLKDVFVSNLQVGAESAVESQVSVVLNAGTITVEYAPSDGDGG